MEDTITVTTAWGKWRCCPTCGLRVWLTKRDQLCKHIGEALEQSKFARTPDMADRKTPRCAGEVDDADAKAGACEAAE